MAKCEVVEVHTPQPPIMVPQAQPDKVEKRYTLTLSEDEAKMLRCLMGKRVGGDGIPGMDGFGVFDALADRRVGIPTTPNVGVRSANLSGGWQFYKLP